MIDLQASDIQISFLEKLVINFALPSDFVYHTLKSFYIEDQYSGQTLSERAKEIWQGKIDKYHKLLVIKEKIPNRFQRVCKESPCGYVRLLLTYLR